MKRIAACLFLFAACTALAAPTRIDAEYQVSKAGLVIGRIVESYERNADTYVIRSTTSSEGALKLFLDDSIVLSSEGRVGSHGLEPAVFEYLERGLKGAGNEIQLTDAMKTLARTQSFYGVEFAGERHDCGSKSGFLRANIAYGMARDDLRDGLRAEMKKYLEK